MKESWVAPFVYGRDFVYKRNLEVGVAARRTSFGLRCSVDRSCMLAAFGKDYYFLRSSLLSMSLSFLARCSLLCEL